MDRSQPHIFVHHRLRVAVFPIIWVLASIYASAEVDQRTPAEYFAIALVGSEEVSQRDARRWVRDNWSDAFLPYFAEVYQFGGQFDGGAALREILIDKVGRRRAGRMETFLQYLWNSDIQNEPNYSLFKQWIHRSIDPRFAEYFDPNRRSLIRLDEITWGGVVQDGIPPLRDPQMIKASDADYLEDDHIVFGISINGDYRAYPKRILAWHEMFTDSIGGVPVAGVYCTLCGSVVVFETEHAGTLHTLGTSGFLYRSNKLMYDRATQSLWSTLKGEQVVGPLVGKGITLDQRAVVTTTWGKWKEMHPDTKVLSLDTGYDRDYGEGIAYSDYFGTDSLMFYVPEIDRSLKNKDEVIALRFGSITVQPTAISTKFLTRNPIYHGEQGGVPYVVFTDSSGASRIYERMATSRFSSDGEAEKIMDSERTQWRMEADALISETGERLERLPAHRAFWFGWHAAFPETRLVK